VYPDMLLLGNGYPIGMATGMTTPWISTSATTAATTIWPQWCNNITSTTTATNAIWINWNQLTIDQQSMMSQMMLQQQAMQLQNQQLQAMQAAQGLNQYQQPQPTAEELQARRETQAKVVEDERLRKVAAARAMELLRANLSQKQREALDKNGWFLVEGGKTKKTYRINTGGAAGNIQELDKSGKPIAKYCVHASYEIPLGDQWLAQALSLRLDEDHIIGKANKTALAA
jgi:hypothetical protein